MSESLNFFDDDAIARIAKAVRAYERRQIPTRDVPLHRPIPGADMQWIKVTDATPYTFDGFTMYASVVSIPDGNGGAWFDFDETVFLVMEDGTTPTVGVRYLSLNGFSRTDSHDPVYVCQPSIVSPLMTKGDIWGYSTYNTRIPVGANGQVMTADSTQVLGVKWAAPGGGSLTGGNVSLSADYTVTGFWVSIGSGFPVTLSSAGTYLLVAQVTGQLNAATLSSPSIIEARLYNASQTAVIGNPVSVVSASVTGVVCDGAAPLVFVATIAAGDQIDIQASTSGGFTSAKILHAVISNSPGTCLSYVKIG